jgi:serine/threonine-protein kinase
MANKILADRYEILEKIGEGGMAVVYKAKDILLGRNVAIKILRPEFIDDEIFIKSFKRESQAAAALAHQNIVSIYDVGEEGNIYYIVMEYISGKTLNEIIEEEAPLSPKNVIAVGKQVAEALSVAHKNGIIHRDIKPHNIMITDEGIVKIADFGIAKAVNNATIVTTPGMIVGSVHYFSPEQARGSAVDAKSDIYSLGVVLYEMLTGTVPFMADNPVTIAVKHMNDKPTPPSEITPGVPVGLQEVIMRCLEKFPVNRFQSAKSLYAALSRIDLENIVHSDEEAPAAFVPIPTKREKFSDTRRNEQMTTPEDDRFHDEEFDDDQFIVPKKKSPPKKTKNKAAKRKRIFAVLGVIVAAILVAVLVFFIYTKVIMGQDEVTVPNVVGMSQAEARDKIEAAGLKVEIGESVASDKYNAGDVSFQSPAADKKVKEGSTVTIDIVEIEEGAAPDVVGQNVDDAKIMIEEAGFTMGDIDSEYSDDVPKDEVISQSPEAGDKIEEGGAISLVVSSGKEVKKVSVPDIIGMSKSQAQNALESIGLAVGVISSDYSDAYDKDRVMWQQYSAGTSLKEGQSVAMKISKGEAPERTMSYSIDLSGASSDDFVLKVTLSNNGVNSTVFTGDVSKSSKKKKVSFTGRGKGKLKVYFDNVLQNNYSVDFTEGTIS